MIWDCREGLPFAANRAFVCWNFGLCQISLAKTFDIELDILNKSIEDHKNRYLNTWYINSDVEIYLEKIKEYKIIFVERKNTLMQLIPLYI